MKAITLTVYLMVDEDERVSKWNVAELIGPEVAGWDIEDGHPDDCPGCEDNHMQDLGLTYDIGFVNTGDGDGWWLVTDAAGESHGGRFVTRELAEEYAEGEIEMFERIQREVV